MDELKQNPYAAPIEDYECPHNCRDMSTTGFFTYSFMLLALGACVGTIIGIILC